MLLAFALAGALLVPQGSPPADSNRVRALMVEGFIDVYYAYDFGRPPQRDRGFTTQAVRHNEVNLNLAHAALTVRRDRVRGRFALQAGTAVQANYSGEPAVGPTSGQALSRHVQEAIVGVELTRAVWLDAGIYLSYVGSESWISRDNPTYSRSLIAEYSPYYVSGLRVVWQPNQRLTLQAHLMNGWQKISEDNDGKALGLRIDYAPSSTITVAYGAFVGNERPTGMPRATRVFNQVMLKLAPVSHLQLQAQADYGREESGTGRREWYGGAAIARLDLMAGIAASARIERFSDPDQAVALTGLAEGLVANGASLGFDVAVRGGAMWRTELRGLRATQPVFSKEGGASRGNAVLITSLALTL